MKWIFVALAILIGIGGLFLLQTVYVAGEFKSLEPQFSGTCEPIGGAAGSEDITIDPGTGMAFVSSFDRRALRAGEAVRGTIYGYDLNSPNPRLIDLIGDFPGEFHPHGISLYKDGGHTRLFVVNHLSDDHVIELFDYRQGKLHHQRTIRDDLLLSPNDLLAVGPESFYVTNDHGSTTAFGKTLEDYLRLPRGNVVYFDGTQASVAAKRIRYANGIGSSGDGATVYVASTTGFRIRVYRCDRNTGELDFDHDVKLRTGVDNIEVDSRGSLLVGCHPKLLTFSKHGADPARLSPSQILRLTLRSQQEASVEEVFLDAGEGISGSSVAAVYGEIMLIGAVFGDHFLLCRF